MIYQYEDIPYFYCVNYTPHFMVIAPTTCEDRCAVSSNLSPEELYTLLAMCGTLVRRSPSGVATIPYESEKFVEEILL